MGGPVPSLQAMFYRLESLEERERRLEELQVETNNLARLSHQIIELVLHPTVKSLVDAQAQVRELQDEVLRAKTALSTLRWVAASFGALVTLALGVLGWMASRR